MKSGKFKILIFFSILAVNFFLLFHSVSAATISRPPTNLGLVAYWSLDEGTSTVAWDMSGSQNNAVVSAGTTWTNGRRGKAVDFSTPASGPNIAAPSSSSLNFGTGSFSISMWGKYRDFTYPKAWFMIKKSNQCYVAGNPGWDIGHSYNSDGLYICYTDGTNLVQNYSLSFDTGYKPSDLINKWAMITVVFDKSANRVKVYVNGVKQTNEYDISTVTGSVNNSANLTIGTMYGWLSDGVVDDVRIYNRALSASEVSAMYRSGQVTRKTVSNSGLVGYWAMNEATGTVAMDSSGNGNNAAISGASWVSGKMGKALSFNGTASSYASIPTISISNEITASAWVYAADFNQYGFIIGKNNVNEQWELFFEGTLLRWRGGAPITDTTYCNIPTNNQWHHVAATQSGTNASLYIDGVLCDTGAVTAIANGSGTIDIGRFNGGYYFNGKIDDVRLYNRVLSAIEIANLYKQNETKINSSQNGKLTSGLVGLWSFDGADVSGSTAYDRSGNARNSTLYGSPSMTQGKMGQGINFTGTGQYTTASGFSEPGTSNQAYTFAAWVRPAAAETTGNIIHMSGASNGLGWCLPPLTISGNKAKAESWNGGQVSVTGTTDVPSGAWTHIATTWDATGGLKIYVNGTLDNSTPQATFQASGGSNYIWISYATGSCSGDSGDFDGDVDDVRIYSRALSASEMKQLYLMGK